jgi:hypothetical protein
VITATRFSTLTRCLLCAGQSAEEAAAKLRPYAEAGVTWWLESVWEVYYANPNELEEMRTRIRQGPVRVG